MADDSIAAVAVVQPSISEKAQVRRIADASAAPSFADQAENVVQIFSRWAGVAALLGTIAMIAWLIF